MANPLIRFLSTLYTTLLLTAITVGPVWGVAHYKGSGAVLAVLSWVLILGGATATALFTFGLPLLRGFAIAVIFAALMCIALGLWLGMKIPSPRIGVLLITFPIAILIIITMSAWPTAIARLVKTVGIGDSL